MQPWRRQLPTKTSLLAALYYYFDQQLSLNPEGHSIHLTLILQLSQTALT